MSTIPEQEAIRPLPMSDKDMATAKEIASRLGFGESTAYTSTSSITGLYCLALRPGQHEGVIVKTEAFGFLFIQDLHDMGMGDVAS